MSARNQPAARAAARMAERDAFAALLACHAPRGAVRAAEALAACAMNRRRRRETLWNGAFARAPLDFEGIFAALPAQPVSARADAAWSAICRRIAARALGGTGPDPTAGGWRVVPADAPAPMDAPQLAARIGTFAFYRDA
jgi:hypothetical protein